MCSRRPAVAVVDYGGGGQMKVAGSKQQSRSANCMRSEKLKGKIKTREKHSLHRIKLKYKNLDCLLQDSWPYLCYACVNDTDTASPMYRVLQVPTDDVQRNRNRYMLLLQTFTSNTSTPSTGGLTYRHRSALLYPGPFPSRQVPRYPLRTRATRSTRRRSVLDTPLGAPGCLWMTATASIFL